MSYLVTYPKTYQVSSPAAAERLAAELRAEGIEVNVEGSRVYEMFVDDDIPFGPPAPEPVQHQYRCGVEEGGRPPNEEDGICLWCSEIDAEYEAASHAPELDAYWAAMEEDHA